MSPAELGGQLHCGPGHLARTEHAERAIPAKPAADCDRLLDAGEALVRVPALVESTRARTAVTAGQGTSQVSHVDSNGIDAARLPGTLTGTATLPASPDTGAELVVAARSGEGRVIFVSIPRRILLQAISATATTALDLAQMATNHDLAIYILARKAGLAGDTRISADAIGAGEQALSMAPPRSRLAVLAATFTGHGYARSGDHSATRRTYGGARELFDTLDTNPHSPCPSLVDENYIALQRARSTAVLGDHHSAALIFQDARTNLPSGHPRDRDVYLARAAPAQAGDREVEHAATPGLEALAIGTETGSARILTELAQLDDELAPWETVPTMTDFRTAMQDTLLREA